MRCIFLEDMLISVEGLGVGEVSYTKGGEARFESQSKEWET